MKNDNDSNNKPKEDAGATATEAAEYNDDEPALCAVCQTPLDAKEIARDNTILARCKSCDSKAESHFI